VPGSPLLRKGSEKLLKPSIAFPVATQPRSLPNDLPREIAMIFAARPEHELAFRAWREGTVPSRIEAVSSDDGRWLECDFGSLGWNSSPAKLAEEGVVSHFENLKSETVGRL
jgi:hypothetical protein